jgi:soluble lytic murein transglycosylase-like protein
MSAVVLCVVSVPSADAEIVRMRQGGTLSIKSHREEGDSFVLTLRSGGEVVCSRDVIAEILPDEVPYPEPQASGTAVEGAIRSLTPGAFTAIIAAAAQRYRLDPRLLHAVITVESNFRYRARSAKGAMGLMQLMPATARQYDVANPYDPKGNIDAGARHLRMLLDRFDLSQALAAYNAGEGAVRRFGGVPPYPETRAYVSRVLRRVSSAR